jgi:hypothetical protein
MEVPGSGLPTHPAKGSQVAAWVATAAMMLGCCAGIFVIVALIPVIGWPAGIVVAVVGGAVMMYAHQRLTSPGSHR